ncbi:MAG: VOC family protein [Gaiellaceae bacterium]
MRVEPLIVVADVEKSSIFYQRLLGCTSGHGGPDFEMLMSDERLLLQLHARQTAHAHPGLVAEGSQLGNGVALWFRTDDFDAAVERIGDLDAEVVAGPLVNPNAHHDEIWIRDLDGYLVVVSDNFGDAD